MSWWCHQMETFSALLAICAGIHRSPVNSPRKGQWRGALMFSLICVWINGWVNNREAGDLRRYRSHYDVIVMWLQENQFILQLLLLIPNPTYTAICLIITAHITLYHQCNYIVMHNDTWNKWSSNHSISGTVFFMYVDMAYALDVLSLLLFASDTDAFITGKNLSMWNNECILVNSNIKLIMLSRGIFFGRYILTINKLQKVTKRLSILRGYYWFTIIFGWSCLFYTEENELRRIWNFMRS